MSTFPTLRVDRSSPVPLYHQVAEQLERSIVDGVLKPGERIVNEVALADTLGLSRPTMRQAISTLVDKGLLVRKRGVGTQVVQSQIRRSVELTSLNDDLLAGGRAPHTLVLRLELIESDETASRQLQLAAGDPVWAVERVRFVGDEPLALMCNRLPASIVDLSVVDLSLTGLYAQLRASGVHVRVAHQTISSRRATSYEARLLNERKGSPLLTMDRTAFDDKGRAIESGSHVYRPDLYSFEVTLVDR
ncbi:MAG: GntR family transcriptional regulator [Nocardioidaceae bacterium]|nr:GntR family transcriptional regulator [Nocardioidaceae bacterium]